MNAKEREKPGGKVLGHSRDAQKIAPMAKKKRKSAQGFKIDLRMSSLELGECVKKKRTLIAGRFEKTKKTNREAVGQSLNAGRIKF